MPLTMILHVPSPPTPQTLGTLSRELYPKDEENENTIRVTVQMNKTLNTPCNRVHAMHHKISGLVRHRHLVFLFATPVSGTFEHYPDTDVISSPFMLPSSLHSCNLLAYTLMPRGCTMLFIAFIASAPSRSAPSLLM